MLRGMRVRGQKTGGGVEQSGETEGGFAVCPPPDPRLKAVRLPSVGI